MILAHNGSDGFVSGVPHPKSDDGDDELRAFKGVKGGDFEVIRMGDVITPRAARAK